MYTVHIVPSSVQHLKVVGMETELNISWEEPADPNAYNLNYTVTITDISVQLSSAVLNTYQLTILSRNLRKYST